MATHKLHWISTLTLTLGLGIATGCAKDDTGDDDGASNSNGDTGSDSSGASSMSASSTNMTTTAATDVSESMSSTVGTDSTATIGTMTSSEETSTEPAENGATCEADEECMSGFCFVVGILGGICGDCNSDADCTETGGGCSIPNPLSQPPEGATCNMGEAGGGCMTTDVCMDGLQCATILDVPGVLTASTCSECLADADCDADLCSPTYDVLNLSGELTCVAAGSVPDGEGCDFMTTGDMACMSGHCGIADVMGLLQLGVCSACGDDMDCDDGMVCDPPTVDLAIGLIAGACAAP
jgi:hypothetical protein